jgi:hypothetical protein
VLIGLCFLLLWAGLWQQGLPPRGGRTPLQPSVNTGREA